MYIHVYNGMVKHMKKNKHTLPRPTKPPSAFAEMHIHVQPHMHQHINTPCTCSCVKKNAFLKKKKNIARLRDKRLWCKT